MKVNGGELVANEKMNDALDFRFFMVHPVVVVVYYIGFFTFAFLFNNPIFILTSLAFSIASAIYYNGYALSAGIFKLTLYFGLFMLIINPLTSHKGAHILFYLFDNPITLEAMAHGLYNFVLIATMLIIFISFNRLIDSERFLYIFSSISPKVAFVTNMTIRYVHLYKTRASELADVQNVTDENQNIGKIAKFRKLGNLLSALVSWSLEEGMKTALVLKSKEYGRHKRSNYVLYKFTLFDGMCLFTLLALFSMLLTAGIIGIGKYNIYPQLSVIHMDMPDWITYLFLVLYLAIPFVLEGYTAVRRKMSNDYSITA